MNKRVVYLAAPASTWETDRYEEYFFKIGHRFAAAELLEAREVRADWSAVLDRIDVLVFLRSSEKSVDRATWNEIDEARDALKEVFMCVTDREENLVLVEWDELRVTLVKQQDNYARFKSKLRAEALAS